MKKECFIVAAVFQALETSAITVSLRVVANRDAAVAETIAAFVGEHGRAYEFKGVQAISVSQDILQNALKEMSEEYHEPGQKTVVSLIHSNESEE